VVGNLVTPIPVTLDGKSHTITVQDPAMLAAIAYTMDPNSALELQLVGSATPCLNLTPVGVINVSDVTLALPTATGANAEPVPATVSG
jgi:ABC-2 type transport system ATP-binding protein